MMVGQGIPTREAARSTCQMSLVLTEVRHASVRAAACKPMAWYAPRRVLWFAFQRRRGSGGQLLFLADRCRRAHGIDGRFFDPVRTCPLIRVATAYCWGTYRTTRQTGGGFAGRRARRGMRRAACSMQQPLRISAGRWRGHCRTQRPAHQHQQLRCMVEVDGMHAPPDDVLSCLPWNEVEWSRLPVRIRPEQHRLPDPKLITHSTFTFDLQGSAFSSLSTGIGTFPYRRPLPRTPLCLH